MVGMLYIQCDGANEVQQSVRPKCAFEMSSEKSLAGDRVFGINTLAMTEMITMLYYIGNV